MDYMTKLNDELIAIAKDPGKSVSTAKRLVKYYIAFDNAIIEQYANKYPEYSKLCDLLTKIPPDKTAEAYHLMEKFQNKGITKEM